MTFNELKLHGTGAYRVSITLTPIPHVRMSRAIEADSHGNEVSVAQIYGGTLQGAKESGSYEITVTAPPGVTEEDGATIILAAYEFHSFQLESAYNGILRFKGVLSAAETYPQKVYDSLQGLTTQEEFEAIPALIGSYGSLRYLPPTSKELQQFLGWQASVSLIPMTAVEQ